MLTVDAILVLSAPRGEDNANVERLEYGLRLALAMKAPVVVSGHPREGEQLKRELEDAVLLTGIDTELHIDLLSEHTVDNAVVGLGRVKERSERWLDRPRPIFLHVVTSVWHRERVRMIFEAVLEMYRRWDPTWRNFDCRLEFHAAPIKTSIEFAAAWAELERGKLMETPGFLAHLGRSRRAFLRRVRAVRSRFRPPPKPKMQIRIPLSEAMASEPDFTGQPQQDQQDPADRTVDTVDVVPN